MKLVDLHEDVAVDVLAEGALPARLVRDQRLQHRPHHVELRRARTDVAPRHLE